MKEKVKVILFVKDDPEGVKYFKMFRLMLGDKVRKLRNARYDKLIETDDFLIEILTIGNNARGRRAHYVMNLTQGSELDEQVARPIERFEYLERLQDPKFKELF